MSATPALINSSITSEFSSSEFQQFLTPSHHQIKLDYISCPNAMHWKFRLLSQRNEQGTTQLDYFLCAVFSCFHTTNCDAYFFMTDGYGIFNMCTKFGCVPTAIHKGGEGGGGLAQTNLHNTWIRLRLRIRAPPGYRTQGLQIWIPTL